MIEYIENMPTIPEELILYDIEEISNEGNKFTGIATGNFSTHKVSKNLYNFLADYFDSNVQIRYQIMRKQVAVHIDNHVLRGVNHVFNYILLTGGEDIRTRWWKGLDNDQLIFAKDRPRKIVMGDELDKKHILYETIIQPKRWHKLQIDTPHDISKIDTPRLGITVWTDTIDKKPRNNL